MFLLDTINCDLLENIYNHISVIDLYHLKNICEQNQKLLDLFIHKKTNHLLSQISMHQSIIRDGAIDKKNNTFYILFYIANDSESKGISIDFSKFSLNSSYLTYDDIIVHFQIDNIPRTNLHYKEREDNRFRFYEVNSFNHQILDFMMLIKYKCGFPSYSGSTLQKIRIYDHRFTSFYTIKDLKCIDFKALINCNFAHISIIGKYMMNKSTNNQQSCLMFNVTQVRVDL